MPEYDAKQFYFYMTSQWLPVCEENITTFTYILSAISALILIWVLIAKRNYIGGWIILSSSLPLLLTGVAQFFYNHLFLIMIAMLPFSVPGHTKTFLNTLSNLAYPMAVSFSVGLAGLFSAVCLLWRPGKMEK